MSFLSTTTLYQFLPARVEGFRRDLVKHGAYELCLGNEYFSTDAKKKVKTNLLDGEQLAIKPGQFAFLITREKITIPNEYIAFISVKYGIKARGLINISGFHVDPGFSGKIKFSVYNAGSKNIVLTVGQPTFLIWFSKFDQFISDPYNGSHQNQNNISNEDVMKLQGEVFSPSYLGKELSNLKHKVNLQWAIIVAILIFLITLTLKNIFPENKGAQEIKTEGPPKIEELDRINEK
jgi:dCTP deaminase